MTSKASLPPFISKDIIFLTSFQPVLPAKSDGKESPSQTRSKRIEGETQLFFDCLPLVKREMRTSITAKSGEVLVLGGLTEDKDSSSKAGLSFLPDFFATSSKTTERTEILLLLHIEVI